jgi:hypothetical protein
MDYSLEEAERPIRIVVADGAVLQWRPTVAIVCRFKDANGEWCYNVTHGSSVVQLK